MNISEDQNIIQIGDATYSSQPIYGRKPFQFSDACSKCAFNDTDECDMMPCNRKSRADKRDVYFVKIVDQNLPEIEKCTDDELNIRMHQQYPELGLKNYCEDYYAAMRLAFQNNLWIQPDMSGKGLWHVYDCDDRATSKDPNPLRAVTKTLLKLKEQEQ